MIILMLIGANAYAMPIQVTNGSVSVTAFVFQNNKEKEMSLDSFHLLARNEDGSFLIYDGQILYSVSQEALNQAVVLPKKLAVGTLGSLETLARGVMGENAAALQEGLMALGYLEGSADGNFGSGTEKAVAAFQKAMGLNATGEADEITQLLIQSLNEETLYIEGVIDPAVMFAPILGRTTVDLQPVMDSGMILVYDDIAGEGFITDGTTVRIDASGDTDLDKYELSLQFGLLTRENGSEIELLPVMKISCLCVRRPMMDEVTVKAGDARVTAAFEKLTVGLDGVYTVEEGVIILTDEMVDALANASEGLKMRVTGTYHSFDLTFDETASAELVGKLAKEILF
ncbi:MAG: peptidoglycan-binding protein [Clostridia bacterium]|nr:peptidoglycan-binding protein [Clostridia bacterium]